MGGCGCGSYLDRRWDGGMGRKEEMVVVKWMLVSLPGSGMGTPNFVVVVER